MPIFHLLPPQNFILCGAYFGSTIALNLQQKLERLLHSSQQQMSMRFFLGIYSFFLVVQKFSSLNFRDF